MEQWTRHIWMSDRRSSPRYRVEHLSDLKGKLGFDINLKQRLFTLGDGGCGFYIDPDPKNSIHSHFLESFRMQENEKVRLHFELNGFYLDRVEAYGVIRYRAKIYDDYSRCSWYFGIEFDDRSKWQIKPLIQSLESLAEMGLLEED